MSGVVNRYARPAAAERLATLLEREGPLGPDRALMLVSQLAEELDHARARGLGHGDLRPDRVVVTGAGNLERFGLLDPGLTGAGRPAERADVYALGALLYECLTGTPPRSGQSAAWLLRPELPPEIDDVLERALAPDPGERYATCSELVRAVQRAVAPAPPWWRSWHTASLLVAVLAAAALLAFLLRDERTTPERGLVAGSPDQADSPSQPAPATGPEPAEPAQLEPATQTAVEAPESIVSRLPGALVRIDAATGEVLARIAIPHPKLVASDGRSVWVLADEGASARLVRIEAATNAVAESFRADVALQSDLEPVLSRPTQLAVAGGSAWAGFEFGPLYRYAPGRSAGERNAIKKAVAWFGWPFAAAGSLWVRNGEGGGGVIRVDPRTRAIVAGPLWFDRVVAAGPGFLWALAEGNEPELRRVDPGTNEVARIGALDLPWDDLTFANGSVWAPSPEDGAIVPLDPVTGAEGERIGVGGEPGPLAAGAGAVWAALGADGAVARYDLTTGRVETIAVGGVPNDLAVARSSVWVAVGELGGSVPLQWERYVARARAICEAATGRFRTAVAGLGLPLADPVASTLAWNQTAARVFEEALLGLRALTPAKGERARLTELSWLFEQRLELLGDAVMAASNHDLEREERLSAEYAALTRRASGLVPELRECPADLGG